ncbi:hypothetical protein GW626_01530 [Peribacillus muralis]|uniref:hypothetical protein n=1 Tax=Peribacillus muralis TaxID=264697 RepID=UPI001F4DB48E|nr:hypothetical protein [Peribacillus muralis]MCK1994916.1 hypothetical protein [Peribacillus muralis]MCK2015538.1 hypothetical protein [Peribacillus muralis]
MNLKKVFSGCFIFLFVLVVSACESDGVNGGIGKATELDLKEVKTFIDDKKTGFLYVKSAFNSDKESDRMKLSKIKCVAEAEKIDFYVFDAKELPTSELYEQDTSKRTLEQYSGTFAFYQEGEIKEELDFTDISEDDVSGEVEKFVQNMKHD